MHETSTNIHEDNGICSPVDRLNQFSVDLGFIFDRDSITNTVHSKILGEKNIATIKSLTRQFSRNTQRKSNEIYLLTITPYATPTCR